MADAVRTIVIADTPDVYGIHITNLSDGTGESNVVKADKSALTGPIASTEPGSLELIQVSAFIQGFTYVMLEWDHTTDDVMLLLPAGSTFRDFQLLRAEDYRHQGRAVLADPRSSGGTGDVILTTAGAVSGATYDIELWFKKSA